MQKGFFSAEPKPRSPKPPPASDIEATITTPAAASAASSRYSTNYDRFNGIGESEHAAQLELARRKHAKSKLPPELAARISDDGMEMVMAISAAEQAEATKKGRRLTDSERAQLASQVVGGGGAPSASPALTKRQQKKLDAQAKIAGGRGGAARWPAPARQAADEARIAALRQQASAGSASQSELQSKLAAARSNISAQLDEIKAQEAALQAQSAGLDSMQGPQDLERFMAQQGVAPDVAARAMQGDPDALALLQASMVDAHYSEQPAAAEADTMASQLEQLNAQMASAEAEVKRNEREVARARQEQVEAEQQLKEQSDKVDESAKNVDGAAALAAMHAAEKERPDLAGMSDVVGQSKPELVPPAAAVPETDAERRRKLSLDSDDSLEALD